MKELYPLKLIPATRSPIWSGKRLRDEWGKISDSDIGESWELCVRRDAVNVIKNGDFSGTALSSLIEEYGEAITGNAEFSAESFPLLVKLIDAGDDLSVQVHPDDEYASRVENDRGKTDMWYIVDAEPDSRMVFGLREGVGKNDLAAAIESGDPHALVKILNYVPVRAGECYFIPAGLPHAIGKGILIAEIQQNCDLTYRMYDYGRLGLDGKPRELHVEKALDVTKSFGESDIDSIRYARSHEEGCLADCEYFCVKKLDVDGCTELFNDKKMLHLLVIDGEGEIVYGQNKYPFSRGSSYLLPAALGKMTLSGKFSALLSSATI